MSPQIFVVGSLLVELDKNHCISFMEKSEARDDAFEARPVDNWIGDSGTFESRLRWEKVESSFKVIKGTLFVGEWPRLKI